MLAHAVSFTVAFASVVVLLLWCVRVALFRVLLGGFGLLVAASLPLPVLGGFLLGCPAWPP